MKTTEDKFKIVKMLEDVVDAEYEKIQVAAREKKFWDVQQSVSVISETEGKIFAYKTMEDYEVKIKDTTFKIVVPIATKVDKQTYKWMLSWLKLIKRQNKNGHKRIAEG